MNMKRFQALPLSLAILCCALAASGARAKGSPRIGAAINAAPLVVGSITPPPKEWAMFPEEPPALPPVAQPGQPPVAGGLPPQAHPQTQGGTVNSTAQPATVGVVSAPVAHHRELPLVWLALTGLLSLGAMLACGSLILRRDEPALSPSGIPMISDTLEVR